MRLMITLKSNVDAAYDYKYYNKLQGLIYGLLKNTPYSVLHDKHGYKFFCFSNLFPIQNIKTGDVRKLLISSPDKLFISTLEERFKQCNKINIGELSFELDNIKKFMPKITNNITIETATPIIIRIPKKNYEKYGIQSKKEYIFWRPTYSFEAFIKQLEENLIKKYNEFRKTKTQETPLFDEFEFKKTTVNHVLINGKEQKFFGSIWCFKSFSTDYNKLRKDILSFGIETGFGERNTFGFGFVNVVSKNF